jgi:RimJ/RimL family protein N-acetyltransferase
MAWFESLILHSNHCTLKPLTYEYHDALIETVNDGELWKLGYAIIPHPDQMQKEITRRLELQEKGLMLPFVVIDNQSQKVAGMTTYCNIDHVNRRLDIGFTWYAKTYQRTPLNTDCKLMLLTHAFEKLACVAVGFRADYLNKASRQAIERLGAKYEGMVRNYSILPNGQTRDMCLYSILPHEWPRIKDYLVGLFSKYNII